MLDRPLARQYAQRRTFYKTKQIRATREPFPASNVFTSGTVNGRREVERLFQALDELDDLVAMLRHRWMTQAVERRDPPHAPPHSGAASAFTDPGYLSSISTRSMRVVPTLRTARVVPASCQKNSPLRGALLRSGRPAALSTISPPSMTTLNARRGLSDGRGRLARLEREPPDAHPLVVEDLGVALAARPRREPARCRVQQFDDDVVERRVARNRDRMRERFTGVVREVRRAAPTRRRRGGLGAEHLARPRGVGDQHADRI